MCQLGLSPHGSALAAMNSASAHARPASGGAAWEREGEVTGALVDICRLTCMQEHDQCDAERACRSPFADSRQQPDAGT